MLRASVNDCATHLRFAITSYSNSNKHAVTNDSDLQRCICHRATALWDCRGDTHNGAAMGCWCACLHGIWGHDMLWEA